MSMIAVAEKRVITFTDKDLPPEGSNHTKALYLALEYKDKKVPRVLVDNGSSINVCPLKTTKCLGLEYSDFKPSAQTIRAYDNTKKGIEGVCTLKVKIGPLNCEVEFYVIDIPAIFDLLLRHLWLYKMDAIACTLHQKVSLPWKDRILTLSSEPDRGIPVCKVKKDGDELSLGGFEIIAMIEPISPNFIPYSNK